MKFVSQKQKNTDAKRLIRRVQRDWMVNKFRESDKLGGTPISAEDKPVAASVMMADIRADKSIEIAMNHLHVVIYGKRYEHKNSESHILECAICREDCTILRYGGMRLARQIQGRVICHVCEKEGRA